MCSPEFENSANSEHHLKQTEETPKSSHNHINYQYISLEKAKVAIEQHRKHCENCECRHRIRVLIPVGSEAEVKSAQLHH